ncbi:MAG: MFS transporter [Actinomycetota bacterium]|nr:MFS transporter [Actinomycetota bacterium]
MNLTTSRRRHRQVRQSEQRMYAPVANLAVRNRWIALLVLCLAELLVSIDNTIVNVALPSISRQLAASTSGLQWIVDAYTLVFAGLLLAAGHLGDRLGRRRVLLAGMIGFGATSAVAASVTTLGPLIGARAVMGAFAALIFPATLALLTNIFTVAKERVVAIGIWSAIAGVAVALGPVSGGYLLEHYSWASVFWVNVPMAVVAVAVTLRWVPESRAEQVGRLDVAGTLLSVAGITVLVWSVIEGPQHGWASALSLAAFALAAVLLVAFAAWELRVSNPILNVALFANRRFSAAAGAISIAFFGLFGFIFLITQYFQAVKGYGTLDAGLRTLPFALVIGATAPLAVQLAQRFGAATVITTGLVLMSAGFAVASTSQIDTAYFGRIIVAMMLMAGGLGLITGPATESIMTVLPLREAGAGSAVNDTTREIGGTLGVAVMGSVLVSLYGGRVRSALEGLPLPTGARSLAMSSVTGGLDVARVTSDPQLATQVQNAFIDGLHAASLVAAAATLAGAVIVAVTLPARRSRPEATGPATARSVALASSRQP